MNENDKEYREALISIAKNEKKLASLKWNFFRGVIYGLGFFIGSALLAAVLIYILSKIQGWAYIGDFVKQIIDIFGKTQP